MKLEGAPILDTLDGMYRSLGIEDFMRGSFEYCQEHEGERGDLMWFWGWGAREPGAKL